MIILAIVVALLSMPMTWILAAGALFAYTVSKLVNHR